jgi:FMN hydrolase / 5-amino-6-(5-phospho-D-ribitylamino)uracil phosphatase
VQQNIKAVTFDLDDTFWPVWPAIGRAEQEMAVWLEEHAPQILEKFGREGLQRLRDQMARRKPELAHHISLMRILALREAAEQAGYSPSVGEQAFQVMWEERNRVELFDDVEPVLRWLRNQGLTLGALSNGNADIDRVGLGEWFDFALNALSGGAPKPDSAMFTKAASLAGCQPSQIVHVGDDLVSDVQGAANAGMVTVWLNRSGEADAAAMPDFEISSLAELPGVIDGLKGRQP